MTNAAIMTPCEVKANLGELAAAFGTELVGRKVRLRVAAHDGVDLLPGGNDDDRARYIAATDVGCILTINTVQTTIEHETCPTTGQVATRFLGAAVILASDQGYVVKTEEMGGHQIRIGDGDPIEDDYPVAGETVQFGGILMVDCPEEITELFEFV